MQLYAATYLKKDQQEAGSQAQPQPPPLGEHVTEGRAGLHSAHKTRGNARRMMDNLHRMRGSAHRMQEPICASAKHAQCAKQALCDQS